MKLVSIARALLAATVIAGATSVALAEEASTARQSAEMRIQELRERLALSPEQEQQLAPLLQQRNARLQELRAKQGPDSSRREKRALLKEARAIQEDFTAQIKPILTAEQMREWEAFRKEARAEATERYRSRQN